MTLWDRIRDNALTLVLTAVVAVLFVVWWKSTPAKAEGVGTPSSIAGPITSFGSGPWTGFYISGGVGKTTTEAFIFSADETLATIGGGYKYQFPSTRLVAGLHADYSFTVGGNSSFYDMDRSWYAGARLGGLLSDALHAYGSVGYTYVGGTVFGSDQGLTLGGGLEWAVTKNSTLGIDYRKVDLGDPMGTGGLFQVHQDEWRLLYTYKF